MKLFNKINQKKEILKKLSKILKNSHKYQIKINKIKLIINLNNKITLFNYNYRMYNNNKNSPKMVYKFNNLK